MIVPMSQVVIDSCDRLRLIRPQVHHRATISTRDFTTIQQANSDPRISVQFRIESAELPATDRAAPQRELQNLQRQSPLGHHLAAARNQEVDLAVVLVDTRVLERVEHGFL
jgi:hypothetical protein